VQIKFKPAEIIDQQILTELRHEFCEFEPFPNPLDDATNHAVVRQLIENEQLGKIWLILADGEMAGYFALTYGYSLEYAGRDALIDELFIREQFRGRSIGKQTIEFVSDFCRAINIKALHLEVEHENKTAQALYHKTGFVDHDRYFLTKWIESV
jgi:diamine N-acetyltransferase